MNEKFNKNAKVEKFTTMLGIAVRLIVIDPLCMQIIQSQTCYLLILYYMYYEFCFENMMSISYFKNLAIIPLINS